MSAPHTISKGVTVAQFAAFESARNTLGLSDKQAKEHALKLFVESAGLQWPATASYGGKRTRKAHNDKK